MKDQITTSKQYSLNWRDAGKGCLVAAASAGFATLYSALSTAISNPPLHIDWGLVGISAATAGVGYIVKNFFTPSQTVIKTPTS